MPPQSGFSLTSSVVLYKTPKYQIEGLLKSVLPSAIERLFIIDNSPNDRWRVLERHSHKIRYIHSENLGYGSSHNTAIHLALEAGAKYHIALNPDIRFESDVPQKLATFLDEHSEAVYVLPKVVYPSGEVQFLCKLLPTPSDLIFRRFVPSVGFLKAWKAKKDAHYCLKTSGYNKTMNPPCLSGCFMFLRLDALKANDIFFDERFFMYFEDFDLIRRLHRVGKTLFYPDVCVIHDHAAQSYKSKAMLLCHIKSAVRYFDKYGWLFDKERHQMNDQILKEISVPCTGGGI